MAGTICRWRFLRLCYLRSFGTYSPENLWDTEHLVSLIFVTAVVTLVVLRNDCFFDSRCISITRNLTCLPAAHDDTHTHTHTNKQTQTSANVVRPLRHSCWSSADYFCVQLTRKDIGENDDGKNGWMTGRTEGRDVKFKDKNKRFKCMRRTCQEWNTIFMLWFH